MARSSNESTSDLFIRLGLSYDELESGFVNAERTIRDNMSRLSRENQIISLQAQVEILGLDETADAERILEIRTKALNEQIEKQKDRVRLASAELQNMIDRTGENSDQTQRARLALERERLALAQLENQLGSLNDAQEETNEGFGGLDSILDRLPPEVKAVGGALLTVTTALLAAGAASKELVEKWRELQNTAYDLNMSVNDTENFLRHMKLAGGDYGDFEGYIRGITDAWTKGENDDPEFIALSRYGAKIVDVTGRLKNFQQITEEVYQAYLKAKAAGEEIEFLQLTGGESGIRDAIQYFERYAEAKEDAAKIFDAGLDPAEMHKAERLLNLLTMQMGEFKDAAVNVITPGTVEMAERLFEVFRAGTETIANNTDALRHWGGVFADSFVSSFPLLRSIRQTMNVIAPPEKDAEETKENLEQAQKSWADYRRELEETAKAQKQAQKSWADFQRTMHEGGNPLNQYDWQRIKGYREELEDLRAELDNFNNDYKKSLVELELWQKRALTDPNYLSQDEKLEVLRLSRAKLEQIEKQRAQDLKEIREDVAAELGSDLDRQLLDIQRQKKDWISAGMEAAEAEELMEKLKLDAIEELEKEFFAERDALQKTDLQNQLDAIDREKEAWIDKGISEAEATELAERKKQQIMEEVSQRVQSLIQEAANIEYHATHTSIENQRYDIEQWKQAKLEQAETAEEVTAIIALAAAKERQIVEESLKRASDLTRETAAIGYHMTHDSLENQIYDIQRWRDEKLEQAATAEEAAAIIANAEAKESAAIKQEIDRSLERADSLNRATAAMTYHAAHEAFENQLYDIEQWKEAQLEKATTAEEVAATIANAAAKEADAFEREMDRIQGKMESAQDRLARLKLSQRDYDIYRAQKQYEKDLEELPRVLADEIYSAELSKIGRDTERANLQRQLKTANDSNRDWIQKQLDSLNLGYTDTPQQRYKSPVDAEGILNAFQERLKFAEPLLTVNAKNYAKFKAQQELDRFQKSFPAATANFTDVSDIFNGQLLSATASVTDFDKAIKQATGGLRGGNTSAGEGTQGYQNLRELFRDGKNGRFPIVYLDELSKEVASLGSGTREALNKILDKAPEGVDVSPIRDLINNQIIRPQALGDAMLGLSDDLKAQLSTALTEGEKTFDMRSSEAMINSMANLAEKMQNAIETIETAKDDISTAAESVKGSNENLSGSLNQMADKVNGLREALANLPTRQNPDSQQQNAPDMSALVQELQAQTGLLGEIKTAVLEIQQQSAAPDDNQSLSQSISDAAQQLSQSISEHVQSIAQAVTAGTQQVIQSVTAQTQSIMQAIAEQTSQMVQALGAVSQAMAESARALTESRDSQNQRSAPNINVSPTNNINLGGAYVFDNSMKRQLTDDIAAEVADAVTSAVSSFESRSSYGYATL